MSNNMTTTKIPQIDNDQVFAAKKMAQLHLVTGIPALVIGVFTVAVNGIGGALISFGILSIIMSFVRNIDDYVTLGSDYIAIKSPFKNKKHILFTEIKSIEKNHKKIIICYKEHSLSESKEQKIKIDFNNLMKNDEKERFLKAFNQSTANLNTNV